MKSVYKAISVVFHPIFLTTFCMAYILFVSQNPVFTIPAGKNLQWLGIVFYSTMFMPLFVVFLLRMIKFIDSFEMETAKERYIPLIACMSFYFWVFWIFYFSLQAPNWILILLLSSFISMVLLFLFTIFNKVSLHVGATSAIFIYAVLLNVSTGFQDLILLVAATSILGVVWLSRKTLKAHTNPQLILGAGLGAVASLIAFLIF